VPSSGDSSTPFIPCSFDNTFPVYFYLLLVLQLIYFCVHQSLCLFTNKNPLNCNPNSKRCFLLVKICKCTCTSLHTLPFMSCNLFHQFASH
jgi:hypothetical protein